MRPKTPTFGTVSRFSFGGEQDRRRYQVSDILILAPNLPKICLATPFHALVILDQFDGLSKYR